MLDELVAKTLFPEDGMIGSMLERSTPGNKNSIDLCGEVSNTTSAAIVDKRHNKKLKICQEQRNDIIHYGNLILHIIGVQGFVEVRHTVKITVSLDYVVPIFTFLLTKMLLGMVYH